MRVNQWKVFETEFSGPIDGNPFIDVDLRGVFQNGHRKVCARGFYDGGGRYRLRFMPDTTGVWRYETVSSRPELSGLKGEFEVVAPAANDHGPVEVVNRCAFAYADGTPFVPIGTTAYAWIHQSDELVEKTLLTLESGPFNKIRMCLFPKHYAYNSNEPDFFVFPGSLQRGFDLTRFEPQYFSKLEAILSRLAHADIEADLILFHPYDRWGFQSLEPEVENRYLRYVVSRLAAYRNVWWSMANEWDIMREKTEQDFHRYFRIVEAEDPYGHLRSVHNCRTFYPHEKSWVTHCSVQSSDVDRTSSWRKEYGKPVVVDECCYEGNIAQGWGNISAEELLRRLWTVTVGGGWPGAHGETYYNAEEILWWSKGGSLIGDAPPRIAFMRKLLEDSPVLRLSPLGMPSNGISDGERYFLYYCGLGRPLWKDIPLPDDRSYLIDVIDTWNMSVSVLGSGFHGHTRVPLPGKEYVAIRCVAV